MNVATTTAAAVRSDLLAEQAALDVIVGDMTDDEWMAPTPSPGWSVADQIGHLAYFDGTASMAVTDPQAFTDGVADLMASMGTSTDPTLAAAREMTSDELLASWRANRATLADAAANLGDDTRVVWYGPSMGAKSFLTARLMETWAHGQDIVDAVGASRESTDRLRHIAQLGYITRGWSYINRGLELPDAAVRVELAAPSGDFWTYGSDDTVESVVGSAEDFCLVVTQRRHIDDTNLVVTGPAAREWMLMAQAFAGAPTTIHTTIPSIIASSPRSNC